MGLAVEVGMLAGLIVDDEEGAEWLRESLAKVNLLLAENGLPSHSEPETLPLLKNRASIGGYPYSFIHYLRRFTAHVLADPGWMPTPFQESADPAEDPLVKRETEMLRSHLLCHSDCEGFYLPIDFAELLIADEDRLPGGVLGSSQLLRELVAVAPFLGISVSGGVSDAEAERINAVVEANGPFWIELAVWISLYEAARLSIEFGAAICFT